MDVQKIGDTGEPELMEKQIVLPEKLEMVTPARDIPAEMHRWNTNEEVAAILVAFDKHAEWQSKTGALRPPSGSILLYNRKQVRYRKDGYSWKKRKDGRTTREDHMKLKLQGVECIYGCYVHSAVLPTFHRRCYWLFQNPDIVLVHYLNVPLTDDNKLGIPTLSCCSDNKEWTQEDLILQLRPMFASMKHFDPSAITGHLMEETIQHLVSQVIRPGSRSSCTCAGPQGSCTGSCTRKCRNICPQGSGPSSVQSRLLSYINSTQKVARSGPTNSNALNMQQLAVHRNSVTLPSSMTTNALNSIIRNSTTAINDNASGQLILNLSGSNGLIILSSQTTEASNNGSPSASPMPASSTSNNPLMSATVSARVDQAPDSNRSVLIQNIVKEITEQTQAIQGHSQGHQPSLSHDGGQGHTQGQGSQSVGDRQLLGNMHDLRKALQRQQQNTDNRQNNSEGGGQVSLAQLLPSQHGKLFGSGLDSCLDDIMSGVDVHDMDTSLEMLQASLLDFSPEISMDGSGYAISPTTSEKFADLAQTGLTNVAYSRQSHFIPVSTVSMDTLGSIHNLSSPQNSNFSLDHFDMMDLPDFDSIRNPLSTLTPSVMRSTNPTRNVGQVLMHSGNVASMESSAASLGGDMSHADPVAPSTTHSVPVSVPAQSTTLSHPHAITMTTSMHNCSTITNQMAPADCVNCKREPSSRHCAGIANITDFSPEWSFTEGNSKVLVTGPWYSSTSPYTVLFDGITVPAKLVQSGVLRCFCPAHQAGLVTIQVACEGFIISDSCVFDYRQTPSIVDNKPHNWFDVTVAELQCELIKKLDLVEKHLDSSLSEDIMTRCYAGLSSQELESKLVDVVRELGNHNWVRGQVLLSGSLLNLTLLHLVAALGYDKLAAEVIHWRNQKPCLLMQYEVDAESIDQNACTPLMWACVKGHTDMAVLLYQWNSATLNIANKDGHLPLAMARNLRHYSLIQHIESLSPTDNGRRAFQASFENSNKKNPVKASVQKSKFIVPQAPVRQGKVIQGQCQKSTKTANSIVANRSMSTSCLGDLTIDIPPSPPTPLPYVMNIRPSSAQNTPKVSSAAQANSVGLHSVVIGNTDIICGQNVVNLGRRSRLMKRTSVEVLPDFPLGDRTESKLTKTATATTTVHGTSQSLHNIENVTVVKPTAVVHRADVPLCTTYSSGTSLLRTANSDPHLASVVRQLDAIDSVVGLSNAVHGRSNSLADPMISRSDRDLNSPLMFMHLDSQQASYETGLTLEDIQRESTAMETDSPHSHSVSNELSVVSRDQASLHNLSDEGIQQDHQMITLANQIIAAIPERIKYSPGPGDDLTAEEILPSYEQRNSFSSSSPIPTPPCTADSGISTPLEGMAFEEYRYPDLGTPASSLSPASSCLHSPYSCFMDSPPPTTEEFTEYFNAPSFYMEKDFSQLTLSDEEQRRLYAAAKIIQNFYRRYKDKKELQQRQKEMEAAILIQSYYRRYKQYMYYKKMTQAAVLIQSQFRSYYAQKLFRKSREAATIIQNRYRAYKNHERFKKSRSAMIQQRYRSHYQRKREGSLTDKSDDMATDTDLNSLDGDPGTGPPSSTESQCAKSSKDVDDVMVKEGDTSHETWKEGDTSHETPGRIGCYSTLDDPTPAVDHSATLSSTTNTDQMAETT